MYEMKVIRNHVCNKNTVFLEDSIMSIINNIEIPLDHIYTSIDNLICSLDQGHLVTSSTEMSVNEKSYPVDIILFWSFLHLILNNSSDKVKLHTDLIESMYASTGISISMRIMRLRQRVRNLISRRDIFYYGIFLNVFDKHNLELLPCPAYQSKYMISAEKERFKRIFDPYELIKELA